ncbi:Dipeptidyl peptidase 2 [Hypsibius exemplaris]|uniref:Dipeptidyl peptidase 2 n=1 Tax=Hypsibius exemplaris TaxID=2072580 RepID=A0A1W0X4S3_HYPEX|nr:Dipeptidyl peptidase 2 [Hypsibius exemplaris]
MISFRRSILALQLLILCLLHCAECRFPFKDVHASRTGDIPPYKELFFDNLLDHFNYGSFGEETYRQRYLLSNTYWKAGGPIFFYTGNEGPITNFYNNTGFIFDIAPKFNALIIFAEHRFYGQSLPAGPVKSFQSPYLGLLTIEQALADFAVLLSSVKAELNATDSAVISFGGSYGGMLAAYMRQKYPNIIDGALAASSPVLSIADIGDNGTFFRDVTNVFKANEGCEPRVREAFTAMDALSKNGKAGFANLTTTFQLCDPLDPNRGYKQLIGWVRNAFASMAMVNYPYPANFLGPLPAWPVNAACGLITNSTVGAMAGLAQAASLFYTNTQKCYDIWSEFVDCADPTGCGTGNDATAWDYQACTQMTLSGGTYGGDKDMFPYLPWTKDMRKAYCGKHYNIQPRDTELRTEYWGGDLQATSNIIYSNGLLDPWHDGGILKNVSDTIVAVTIKDGAHHLDLRASDPRDPQSVIVARQQEVELIRQFVKKATTVKQR